ncbi:MAG: bifunctional molybdenum cofactor biosynthesis protein MoaC/MoaB [Candidatus Krumholzibacteriia bacterium]
MKSVTAKTLTLRRAVASGCVKASTPAIRRLQSNDLPKKDVLAVARVAGTHCAKKTFEIIPYCHPLPVDLVEIKFDVGEDFVHIRATVEAVAKTGVEMEALTAVSAAALTIYDMLKPIDTGIEIQSVKLESKKGGKRDFPQRVPAGFKAAVLVVSDGTHQGTREDRSGRLIRERLEALGLRPSYEILPDEEERIAAALRGLAERGTDLVLTTGGTGLGPRDVTVEATRRVIDREVPGIAEAMRTYGQSRTPYAMLSRGVAGLCGRTIIVNLPGSSRGTEESLNAILPGVFHAFPMLKGDGH